MQKLPRNAKLSPAGATVRALLAELKEKLRGLYGDRLYTLVLYGSYARGTAQAGSDLDVAVVLDGFERPWPEIDRTGPLVADLSLQYGMTISLIPVRQAGLGA